MSINRLIGNVEFLSEEGQKSLWPYLVFNEDNFLDIHMTSLNILGNKITNIRLFSPLCDKNLKLLKPILYVAVSYKEKIIDYDQCSVLLHYFEHSIVSEDIPESHAYYSKENKLQNLYVRWKNL